MLVAPKSGFSAFDRLSVYGLGFLRFHSLGILLTTLALCYRFCRLVRRRLVRLWLAYFLVITILAIALCLMLFFAYLASLLAFLHSQLFLICILPPFFYPLSPFSLMSSGASSLCFGITTNTTIRQKLSTLESKHSTLFAWKNYLLALADSLDLRSAVISQYFGVVAHFHLSRSFLA